MATAGTAQPPRRILLIKPSSLGDIVHALPILAGLRRAWPQTHIAWLVASPFVPLLTGHPLLNEVIPFDRRHYGRMLRSPRALLDFLRFVRQLRRQRFDLVIDLQGLFRSGLLAFACGAPRRVGFAAARELAWVFYTQRVRCPNEDGHAVDRNLALARSIGLPVDPPDFPLGLRDEELAAGGRLITATAGQPLDHYIAVVPGARWETKRWRADRLARLIEGLAADGLPPCVLLGGPDDRTFTDAIVAACKIPVTDLVGRTTLRELTAAIARAELVICQDSGPMHIAAALGKPLVAIFGPTNPARTGPYGVSARIVALPLDCVPCYRRQCPLGHHHCMQQLHIDPVLECARQLLRQEPGNAGA
jgi:lipopolysaccharide heptosyltransferase I